jgi:integrase
MTTLGLATGLRPSSLRPLRRNGERPDVLWDQGVLLVRRSQTIGEAIERTKTGLKQRIPLPPECMDILRWQVDRLTGKQAASDLLFPSETGGYRALSVLDKPFRAVANAIGLGYPLTARAMRRTFQDLGRAARIGDLVVRSISGHATEAMQRHYSTVSDDERRAGLAQIIDLMQVRRKTG